MNRIHRTTTSDVWKEMIGRSFEPRQWFEEEGWPDHPSDYKQEGRIMWVYRKLVNSRTGKEDWVVGFYSPDRHWHEDTTWPSQREAAKRVHWLNGGGIEAA